MTDAAYAACNIQRAADQGTAASSSSRSAGTFGAPADSVATATEEPQVHAVKNDMYLTFKPSERNAASQRPPIGPQVGPGPRLLWKQAGFSQLTVYGFWLGQPSNEPDGVSGDDARQRIQRSV